MTLRCATRSLTTGGERYSILWIDLGKNASQGSGNRFCGLLKIFSPRQDANLINLSQLLLWSRVTSRLILQC